MRGERMRGGRRNRALASPHFFTVPIQPLTGASSRAQPCFPLPAHPANSLLMPRRPPRTGWRGGDGAGRRAEQWGGGAIGTLASLASRRAQRVGPKERKARLPPSAHALPPPPRAHASRERGIPIFAGPVAGRWSGGEGQEGLRWERREGWRVTPAAKKKARPFFLQLTLSCRPACSGRRRAGLPCLVPINAEPGSFGSLGR